VSVSVPDSNAQNSANAWDVKTESASIETIIQFIKWESRFMPEKYSLFILITLSLNTPYFTLSSLSFIFDYNFCVFKKYNLHLV